MHGLRSLVTGVVLGLALLAGGAGFLAEATGALATFDAHLINQLPSFWHFGMAPVERLRACLSEAAPLVPPDSVVVFVSPSGPDDADFFRWRWAAYLLPNLHLVQPAERRQPPPAQYLLTYHAPVDEQALVLIRQLNGCRLYRILDP